MYLKAIKLSGFKSFADPTLIPIRGPVSAIVGPNGCGKSNVVDAVRWVFGETSAKQLRGQLMSDVIFNGTTSRKPVGKASIELHFDNFDGRIGGEFAQYAEIAVRREVERDGQSNYFVNGIHVRRRDVVDMFLGTGLGVRSYAVIEQGMISNLIEAKPEELRAHIEEAAGISKYKERRRETENRMSYTKENLGRVNDICEELDKQLRHLKQQANVAERYKLYKEKERLLSAQIKALQWKRLNLKALEFDEMLNRQNILREEKQSDQYRIETEIERVRSNLSEANQKHQEFLKEYYKLGAEISLLKQSIKEKKERKQRCQIELEENESLLQELQNNNVECEKQISGLECELDYLNPLLQSAKLDAISTAQALSDAEAAMSSWGDAWETLQVETSKIDSQFAVMCVKKTHLEQQLIELDKRRYEFQQNLNELQLDKLNEQISPLEASSRTLGKSLEANQAQLKTVGEEIAFQREANNILRSELEILSQVLQATEARTASLDTLQKSVLGGFSESVNEWLSRQGLQENLRLGQNLVVECGWEVAVETVLSDYFDAICVDSLGALVFSMSELSTGRITIVERSEMEPPQGNKRDLCSKVNGHWPFKHWLTGIYTAESLKEAVLMRSSLQNNESVITRDGIWLGPNWIQISKTQNAQSGFLLREKELKQLRNEFIKQQEKCNGQKALLLEGERKLTQQEAYRESLVRCYQELSSELNTVNTALSAKKTKLEDAQLQQVHLKESLSDCEYKIIECQKELELIKNKSSDLIMCKKQLFIRKEELLRKQKVYKQELVNRREEEHQKRKEVDELELRLAGAKEQLNLLKQSLVRDQRQLNQLTERRSTLSQYLVEVGKPLKELSQQLEVQLEKQINMEKELHTVDGNLKEINRTLVALEKEHITVQEGLTEIQDQLEKYRMQRQMISIRQTTIQEQLSEGKFSYEQVIRELPEAAQIDVWQEKLNHVVDSINQMGRINLAAIEEYESVNERKRYLDKQLGDLTEALEILKNAIRKIDRETRTKFKKTYELVNYKFQSLFPLIFGGGHAVLEVTDADFPGVIIRAQPPGKKNVTIHMLSGGEKALTAIAFVFSLFQLNPAPFCILDEVDAPLDDINVTRFCQLVKEMSREIQFLVISHNKVTIEMADYLMGVTVQEPGVSRIVSVDVQEAMKIVEAA